MSRVAGHYARTKAESLRMRGLMLFAAVLLAGLVGGLAFGFTSWAFIGVELGVICALYAIDKLLVPSLRRWSQGAAGEEDVGRVLAECAEDGWHAIHDVSFGRGNVDHVLVGPAGVLTIETKSHRGRINASRLDERMLKQAYAEAKLVSAISGREVAPLIVFSNAFLYPRAVSRQRGVVVLPLRMLRAHLARRRPQLTADEASELHRRLSQAIDAVGA